MLPTTSRRWSGSLPRFGTDSPIGWIVDISPARHASRPLPLPRRHSQNNTTTTTPQKVILSPWWCPSRSEPRGDLLAKQDQLDKRGARTRLCTSEALGGCNPQAQGHAYGAPALERPLMTSSHSALRPLNRLSRRRSASSMRALRGCSDGADKQKRHAMSRLLWRFGCLVGRRCVVTVKMRSTTPDQS